MTPELEKAARAIKAECYAHYGRGLSIETVTPALARAALLALREPSEELAVMLAVVIDPPPWNPAIIMSASPGYAAELKSRKDESLKMARAAWIAGIDHITGAGK